MWGPVEVEACCLLHAVTTHLPTPCLNFPREGLLLWLCVKARVPGEGGTEGSHFLNKETNHLTFTLAKCLQFTNSSQHLIFTKGLGGKVTPPFNVFER